MLFWPLSQKRPWQLARALALPLALLKSLMDLRIRDGPQEPHAIINYWSVWMEEWKIGRIENEEGIGKWEDSKYLVFFHMCLVGRMEKWREKTHLFGWEYKREDRKCNLYKFQLISLAQSITQNRSKIELL